MSRVPGACLLVICALRTQLSTPSIYLGSCLLEWQLLISFYSSPNFERPLVFQNAGSLLCARQEIANCNKHFSFWLHFPYYQMIQKQGALASRVMQHVERMQWTSAQGSVPIQAVRALRWQKKISICDQPGHTSSLQAVICNIPSRRFYIKLILSKKAKCLKWWLSLPIYLDDPSDHRGNRHLLRESVWFRANC